jgi:acylphosphatase
MLTLMHMSEEMARANILVQGLVQGVFYRASAMERAQGLNIAGTVKNLADGSVELTVEGSRYAVEDFIAWCRNGPPAARVDDVTVRWAPARNEFRTFMVLR